MFAEYNNTVSSKTVYTDAVRLIRVAAILWIAYLVVLVIINQYVWEPRPAPTGMPRNWDANYHYILLAIVALLCLGLSYWSWLQKQMGRAFIPLVITIITVGPFIASWVIISQFPGGGWLGPDVSIQRLLPFLLVGFLLVAWQYGWQHMLAIILGVTLLNLGLIRSFPSPGPDPLQRAIMGTIIQAVIFLAVGFSISYLMSRLRKQQQSLEEANKQLTHYATTLEQLATSRERNRLARELHDTLAHTLSGLAVQLETVKAYWDVNRQTAHATLEKSLAAAHSGLEETRRALKALRASPLDDLGLALALRTMVKDVTANANLTLYISIIDEMPALSPDVEQCVYRVAQEAVNNVVKHAGARNLTVKLDYTDGRLNLFVHDDGKGFEAEKIIKASHYGLAGMKERAELAGGTLTVISQPGQGTTIQLVV